MRLKLIFAAITVLLVLVGCNQAEQNTNPYNLPDYVLNAKLPGAQAAYEYAVEAEEGILEYIPCYCNCYIDPFYHRNVKDCFINPDLSTEDEIVFDEHGYG